MVVVGSTDYCDSVTLVSNPFTLRYPSSAPLSLSLGPITLSPAVVMATTSLSLSQSLPPTESKPIGNFLQNRPSLTHLPSPRFVDFQKKSR